MPPQVDQLKVDAAANFSGELKFVGKTVVISAYGYALYWSGSHWVAVLSTTGVAGLSAMQAGGLQRLIAHARETMQGLGCGLWGLNCSLQARNLGASVSLRAGLVNGCVHGITGFDYGHGDGFGYRFN